jgi:uncharacterized membrane protein YphA (DoxX/SURF4 family)
MINRPVMIADILSALLLLLFLYTSLSKLADYETFKNVLTASPLLKPVAGAAGWLLPVSELLIAILLFVPALRLKGLYASFILIIIFTVYLIYMIAFTTGLPCSCGGVLKTLTWPQHILFNLFFILLSLAGILLHKKGKKIKRDHPP